MSAISDARNAGATGQMEGQKTKPPLVRKRGSEPTGHSSESSIASAADSSSTQTRKAKAEDSGDTGSDGKTVKKVKGKAVTKIKASAPEDVKLDQTEIDAIDTVLRRVYSAMDNRGEAITAAASKKLGSFVGSLFGRASAEPSKSFKEEAYAYVEGKIKEATQSKEAQLIRDSGKSFLFLDYVLQSDEHHPRIKGIVKDHSSAYFTPAKVAELKGSVDALGEETVDCVLKGMAERYDLDLDKMKELARVSDFENLAKLAFKLPYGDQASTA